MTEQRFTIKESWDFGWATVRENAGFLIGVTILVIVVGSMPGWVADAVLKPYPFVSGIFHVAGSVLNIWMQFGLIKIVLKFCDQQRAGFEDLVDSSPVSVWGFFLVLLLGGLAVMAGFLLLIVPGIIIGLRLQFAGYLFIDKNTGVMDALKQSFALTRGSAWDLFIFNAVMVLINLAGLLCLGVGLLVTIPATTLATAVVYRRLAATYVPPVNLPASAS